MISLDASTLVFLYLAAVVVLVALAGLLARPGRRQPGVPDATASARCHSCGLVFLLADPSSSDTTPVCPRCGCRVDPRQKSRFQA